MRTSYSPRERSSAIGLCLLVVGMLTSLPWLISRWYVPNNDAAMFVLTARSILAGEGYSLLGEPFTIRPPGFAYMLAGAMSVVGSDFRLLNLFAGLWAVAAVALLFCLVRPRLGVLTASVLCATIWLAPGFLRTTSVLLSDVPGTALMLGLLVFERRARRARGPWPDAWLALGIGLASLVRSVNVLLVPAILLARLALALRERGRLPGLRDPAWRRAALLVGLPLLVLVPWSWRNARVTAPVPPEQHYVHSYSVGLWHTDPADPASPALTPPQLAARVGERLGELLPSLGARLGNEREGAGRTVDSGLAVLALACCALVLVRRREPSDFLVFGLLAVLAVYFAYQPRLALPLLFLALAAVADTAQWALRRVLPARAAAAAVSLGLLALLVHDFRAPDFTAARRYDEQVAALRGYVEHNVAPEQGLAARQGWHLAVALERPVWSAHMVMRREGAAAAVRMLDGHGVEVYAFQRGPDSREQALWREGLRRFYDVRAELGPWAFAWRNERPAE